MSGADETAFVGGCKVDHVYPREFKNGAGRFFNYVLEEDGATTVEYSPPFSSKNRVKLTLTFIHSSNEITAVTLKRFKQYKRDGWVEDRFLSDEPFQLTHFSFEKLASLLQLLKNLDLASLNQPRIPVVEGISGIDPEFAKKIKALLIQPDGQKIVEELVRSGLITSHDIVNIGYRKAQLEQFRLMLNDAGEVRAYAEKVSVRTDQPEKAWQHFLGHNEWIFGFGLDYRFLGILQEEAVVGSSDIAGRDAPIVDFLLGATHFTVLVEVKQPDTPLFGGSRARSGAWRLSTDLMESVSQVLQQKAAWQVKAETNAAGNYDRQGALIRQRTTDAKCILVIGSDSAFSGSDAEREAKFRTFELFRRDSRNLDILTYSELYERAAFVVGRSARQADADSRNTTKN